MMAVIRRYISILLIFVFLFEMGGHYILFYVWQLHIQKDIKKQIREGLKDEDLSLIIVPLNDDSKLGWTKPNKEFSYKGEMFDVVRLKTDNQHKYYYCIQDIKEKKLISNFNKNHNPRKEGAKKIPRAFIQYFSKPQNHILNLTEIETISIIIPDQYIFTSLDIEAPPPKSA